LISSHLQYCDWDEPTKRLSEQYKQVLQNRILKQMTLVQPTQDQVQTVFFKS